MKTARTVPLAGALMLLLACSDSNTPTEPAPIPVKPVATVSIQPDSLTLMVGATHTLQASLKAADGSVLRKRIVSGGQA